MKKLAVCSVAACAMLLSSCASNNVTNNTEAKALFTSIEGNWKTSEIIKNGEVIKGGNATIIFSEPIYSINGSDGVNLYFGTVEIDGTKLEVLPNLGHSMMAGSEEDMLKGEEYLRAFTHCDNIALYEDNLILSGEKAQIVYNLNNDKVWETESVIYDGKETKDCKATLNIEMTYEDVRGNASVNNYFGLTFTFSPLLKISGLPSSTKMLGPKDEQNFEYAFLNTLPTITEVATDGEKLILSNDETSITFTRISEE